MRLVLGALGALLVASCASIAPTVSGRGTAPLEGTQAAVQLAREDLEQAFGGPVRLEPFIIQWLEEPGGENVSWLGRTEYIAFAVGRIQVRKARGRPESVCASALDHELVHLALWRTTGDPDARHTIGWIWEDKRDDLPPTLVERLQAHCAAVIEPSTD